MCGAEKVRANWYRSIPRLFVIDPSVEFLRGLVAQQNEHIKKYTDMGQELPPHLYVNLILDDIALFDDIMSDKTFAEIVAISRNLGIRMVILAQYLMQIKKKNRKAFNGIGLCGPQDIKTLKEIYEIWGAFMQSKDLMVAVGLTYTKDRGLLMIDRHQQECFKMTMKWPFESIPFGPPSQKIFSDKMLALLALQRKKESFQREQEKSKKQINNESNTLLDTNGWKRFVAENGKTFVFAPNRKNRDDEMKKPIEFFVDTSIDYDDWLSLQNYSIFYSLEKHEHMVPIQTSSTNSTNISNPQTILVPEDNSDSETTISDSSEESESD
jgi:hypothetical protein